MHSDTTLLCSDTPCRFSKLLGVKITLLLMLFLIKFSDRLKFGWVVAHAALQCRDATGHWSVGISYHREFCH